MGLLLKSVYRLSEFGSIRIGLGFGHVSVSNFGLVNSFNTINDKRFTINDT